jgi:hypothetical protein
LQASWLEKHFCEMHELYLFYHINKENGGSNAVLALLEQSASTVPSAVLVNHTWSSGNAKEWWAPADKKKRNQRGTCATRKREDNQSYRAQNVIT